VNSTTATIGSEIQGTSGLIKAGTGTLIFNNYNTYSGDTQITAGTLQLNNNPSLPFGSGAGNVSISSGAFLDLKDRNVSINGLSGAGTVTNSGSSSFVLSVGYNDQTSNFSGVIENGSGGGMGLTKQGTGTLTLSGSNTYTGVTKITSGTLSVASIGAGGSPGNLGAATNVNSKIVFDGGTLQYTGSTASTDRGFNINPNKVATVDVSSSASNLTLSSSSVSGSTDTNSGLTKVGLGTLTLSGTNAYEGATTVKAGILNVTGSLDNSVLGNGNVGGESAVTVGGTGSSGTPTLAGSGTINGATVIAAAGGGGPAGTYSPGDRSSDGTTSLVGVQTFGNASQTTGHKTTLAFQAGSLFEWQLSSNTASGPGTNFDSVMINASSVTIASTATIKLAFIGTAAITSSTFWGQDESWQVFTNFSSSSIATSGSFIVDATAVDTSAYPGGHFTYNSGNGTVNWSAVPEPSSALAGLLLAAGLLRRRR